MTRGFVAALLVMARVSLLPAKVIDAEALNMPGLLERLQAFRRHLANKRRFKNRLIAAVSEGHLLPTVIEELNSLKSELQLSDADVRSSGVKAYLAAYSAATRNGSVTREEDVELQGIQQYLGVADEEIVGPKQKLARLRLLRGIENGEMPTVVVSGLLLQKGETANWSEAASIVEEQVVSRQFVGGSRGVSFRIAKGVRYHVGGFRGHTRHP
jgi:hypothetical protein